MLGKRLLLVSVAVFLLASCSHSKSRSSSQKTTEPLPGKLSQPPTVYIDKGACPFECCTYTEWGVEADAKLYREPHSSDVVGLIKKGENVDGLTGEVHVDPALVTAVSHHAVPGGPTFEEGDTFYLLTYLGEGQNKIWFKGFILTIDSTGIQGEGKGYEYYESSASNHWAVLKERYKSVWWKKIKSKSGVIGWTKEDVFSGQDACG